MRYSPREYNNVFFAIDYLFDKCGWLLMQYVNMLSI